MALETPVVPTTRRWKRVEYDRLVELGVFEGERLELSLYARAGVPE